MVGVENQDFRLSDLFGRGGSSHPEQQDENNKKTAQKLFRPAKSIAHGSSPWLPSNFRGKNICPILSAIPFCKALYHRAILCHEIIVAYQRLNLFPKHLGLIARNLFQNTLKIVLLVRFCHSAPAQKNPGAFTDARALSDVLKGSSLKVER